MREPLSLYGGRDVPKHRRPSSDSQGDRSGNPPRPEGGTPEGAPRSDTQGSEAGRSDSTAPTQELNEAKAAAMAAAAKRERAEWERTRGAGSGVLAWYEALREEHASELNQFGWTAVEVVPPIPRVLGRRSEPVEVVGMDRLLDWGICDYTILPRTLGRGRFSTVYLAVKNGEKFAVKHTPLFPHHELVATRLLREPTLLAELPPHPNLVGVMETIRTPGHFYLVEEFLDGYVTLEALVPMLSTAKPPKAPVLPLPVAERIFSQLVIVLHAIHWPLRICHRDVKPENILVHPESLQLKLLDFGLATHFSKSHPKLTTCCGSPAFHCPEIVTAMSQTPGTVAYWGPEVDAWTCGVTLLRCLSGIRYPLGTAHTTPQAMATRAKRVLQTLPSHPMRDQIAKLLDLNGDKRMQNFAELAQHYLAKQDKPAAPLRRVLKSTSFIPNVPQHAMLLPLVLKSDPREASTLPVREPPSDGSEGPTYTKLTLLNPTKFANLRVLSFIKYCFRCAGILYHTLPENEDVTTQFAQFQAALGESPHGSVPPTPYGDPNMTHRAFECVVELTQDESTGPLTSLVKSVMAMFGQAPKPEPLVVVPRRPNSSGVRTGGKDVAIRPSSGPSGRQGPLRMLVFYVWISFPTSETKIEAPDYFFHGTNASTESVPDTPPRPGARGRADELVTPDKTRSGRASRQSSVRPHSPPRKPRRAGGRANAVHVYISDPRALPYVRGALSGGGVHKPDTTEALDSRRASTDHGPSTRRDSLASPVRSGASTPVEDEGALIGSYTTDEMIASLDAIEAACRATLQQRIRATDKPSEEPTMIDPVRAELVYHLVFRMYTEVELRLSSPLHHDVLQALMGELNFRALEVLAPVLSLVSPVDTGKDEQVSSMQNLGAELGEERAENTGSLALALLELFARKSSAKEMCLGIQEQIARLMVTCVSPAPLPEVCEEETPIWILRDESMLVQAILGLLQLLSMVFPAIKTRKPQAILTPMCALLYPRLFGEVLPPTLARNTDADTQEELTTQAAVLLCEVALNMHTFSQRHLKADASPDVSTILLGSLAALTPAMPHTGPGPTTDREQRLISVRLYSAYYHRLPEQDTTTVSKRVTVWNVVRKTYDELHLDLGAYCLNTTRPGSSVGIEQEPAIARAAMVLLAQQLAYESFMAQVKGRVRVRLLCATKHHTHISDPRRWDVETSTEVLSRLSAVMPLVLLPGMTLLYAPAPASTLERMDDLATTDAALSLITWALNALDQSEVPTLLDAAHIPHLVRGLALWATHTPCGAVRQAAFTLVSRMLQRYTPDALALRLVFEMLHADAPAPLRASGVSLVRTLCGAHIARLEAAHAHNADADALLENGRMWYTLHDVLFVVPDLPWPKDGVEALALFLGEHGAYLLECCALYYFVLTRDQAVNFTGLRDPAAIAQIHPRFFAVLSSWERAWSQEPALPSPLANQLSLIREQLALVAEVPSHGE